jgi:hypothetical protein
MFTNYINTKFQVFIPSVSLVITNRLKAKSLFNARATSQPQKVIA